MTRLSLSLALVLSLLSCGGEQATGPSADVEDSQGEDSGGLGEVCVPDCSGKPCGEADGCQGLCGGVQADSGDPEAATLSVVVEDATKGGLALGRDVLLDAVQDQLPGYTPTDVDLTYWSVSQRDAPACPLSPSSEAPAEGVSCSMILEMARVQAISSLDQALEDNPYLEDLEQPEDAAEVSFWYEQGAIGGVDLWAQVLRWDLPGTGLCPVDGSAVEQARSRGEIHGATEMAEAFNVHLSQLGHEPAYPQMTQGTDLCGLDFFELELPLADAQERVAEAVAGPGPCDLSEPPEDGDVAQWTAERDAWESGLEQGVADEHSLLSNKLRLLW